MNNKLRTLDLFSGIGGFSLGLESTGGFRTVAFCEIEPYPRKVLAKHWPGVPCYNDVSEITAHRLAADGIAVDIVCGGFPCQDISVAGRGAGLSGDRSGLWFEMLRVITEARPKFAIIENVPALRSRGLDEVLRGLASIGFDAEWHCIPAAAVGAPHRRDRIWIVAYPNGQSKFKQGVIGAASIVRDQNTRMDASRCGKLLAGGHRPRLEIKLRRETGKLASTIGTPSWAVEPDVGRVAYGVPARVERITCLGNAVVPQVVAAIGRAILASMGNEATGDSVANEPYRPDVEQSPA